jgi:glycosyltransferase involved in cell wall biosynthesis
LADSLDLRNRVIFTGQVPKDKVSDYLRAADVFVLNSTYEGLPHIVLEAMQAGVPVIATGVGGTSELVKHGINGLLIRPNDDTGLRMALQQLLTHPDRRIDLIKSGYRTATVDFSFSKMVSRTESLLARASVEATHAPQSQVQDG